MDAIARMPRCLIDKSNPVRVIDAFVDALILAKMSFEGSRAGGDWSALVPPLVPPLGSLLKLYIYDYLNRGSIEPAAGTRGRRHCRDHAAAGRLVPDHKTICARFVELCVRWGVLRRRALPLMAASSKR